MSWLKPTRLLSRSVTNVNHTALFRTSVRASTSKQSSNKEVVHSEWCKPAAAYSAAVKGNGIIFVSGQLGMDPSTKAFVSDEATKQAEQALRNIEGILSDAGSDLNKICKATVLLSDIKDFAAVNEVYANFFKQANVTELPARAAYAVANLPLNAKVEIEAFALE